ncbi:MAG TPA: hypothetical protein VJ548_05270 [Azospira sp.]|nr:hypothetical protein [Azospira sp.]
MVKYSGVDTHPLERQFSHLADSEGFCLERVRQEVATLYRHTWVMAGALVMSVGGLLASYGGG